MSPEVISFSAKRWSDRVDRADGTVVYYGVGKICSSSCFFLDGVQALLAQVAWENEGIEPRAAQTLTDWPAITDAQLEAAAERLVGL